MNKSDFRKKITDSWFSYLQSQICKEFEVLEGSKFKFKRRDWNKKNKRKVEVHHIFYQEEKYLIKLELTNLQFQEFFRNNLEKIFWSWKKMVSIGPLVYQLLLT